MQRVKIKTREGPEEFIYFSQEEADEIGMCYLENWREASGPGQRVLTDDGHVVTVLNVGGSGRDGQRTWVRIPTGTFEAIPRVKMTTERRKNRFSFNGEYAEVKITNRVRLFAMHVGGNMIDPREAHKSIWPNMKPPSRKTHMNRLLRDEKVKKLMRQELQDALKAEGVDETYIIRKLKSLIEDRDEVADKTVLEVIDRLDALMDKAHDEKGGTPQLPGGIFAGLTMEKIRELANGDTNTERISLTQGVSSQQLVGEEPDLDSTGYEEAHVTEEGIEDRDAEDDAD